METSLRCLRPYQLQVTYGICERPHGLVCTLWPLQRIEISGTFSRLPSIYTINSLRSHLQHRITFLTCRCDTTGLDKNKEEAE